jgi:hypothetical protein
VHRRLESLHMNDVKLHGYFVGDAELNDEPNFRCQCGSNVVWSR